MTLLILVEFKEIKDEPESEGEEDTLHNSVKKEKTEVEGKSPSQNGEGKAEEEEEERVFSDHLSEMCLCECKLCGKAVYHHQGWDFYTSNWLGVSLFRFAGWGKNPQRSSGSEF